MTAAFSRKLAEANGPKIVYVRSVAVADLPEETREQVVEQLGDAGVIYSVNDADGAQIALVADRAMAFHLAMANDLAPVSVH